MKNNLKINLPDCLIAVDIQAGFMNQQTNFLPQLIKDFCDNYSIKHRIFTRFINPGPKGPFVEILKWNHLSNKTETALCSKIIDLPTMVLDKFAYSPFFKTNLEDILKDLRVKDVLVFGIDTDICVLFTAVGLFERNFRPLIISDLCASTGGLKDHQDALEILPRYIGDFNILTTNDFNNLFLSKK